MRIIGGTHRGRVINPPSNLRARPTTDFAKENLFNVLQNFFNIEDARVLDLFAGTGSIGYEFMSRGAAEVTAVDVNRVHCEFIRRTAQTFGFDGLHVVQANAFLYLKNVGRQFDLIFADAPYDLAGASDTINLVLDRNILPEGGILIFEHGKGSGSEFEKHTNFLQQRGWGNVMFSFFIKK